MRAAVIQRRALVPFASLLLAGSCALTTPDIGPSRPPSPSPSPSPPTALSAELRAAFAEHLDETYESMGVVGMGAAVVMPNGEMWVGTAGQANVDEGTALTPDSVFLVPDNPPARLTAVILRLVDHGTIALDDPVRTWLSEVDVPGLDDRVTVRHLLAHTSGIDDFVGDPDLWRALTRGERLAPGDFLRFVKEPAFPLGERWEFSATNLLLLALVAEGARGMQFYDLLEDEVARPLQLSRSFPDPRAPIPRDVAFPHLVTDGAAPEVATNVPEWNRLRHTAYPIGTVATSVGDYARVASALFNGDYLSPATRAQLMADPVDANVPPWGRVRAGLTVMETSYFTSGTAVGAGGAGLGYVGNAWHFPEMNVTIVAMVNEGPGPQPELLVDAIASRLKHWDE